MARPIDLAKWHQWAERPGRFERSGMSVCAWCRQEGVSDLQFYQWRRKLAAHGWLQVTVHQHHGVRMGLGCLAAGGIRREGWPGEGARCGVRQQRGGAVRTVGVEGGR